MNKISVYKEKGIKVDKKSVQSLISLTAEKLNKRIVSMEINFVHSDTILEINTKFLGHKYTTDVISFDYSIESNSFDGEIFICVEKAAENSKRFKVSIDDELNRLVVHGMLHFSGYNDSTVAQRRRMKKVEDQFLYRYKKNRLLKNL